MEITHGRKLVRVVLDKSEWIEAFSDAFRRATETGSDRQGAARSLGYGILAVGAEMAVAAVTNRKWLGYHGQDSEDVEGLQVKFTNTRYLAIHERNPDGRYVLVSGGLRGLVVRGWYDFARADETTVRAPWADQDERDNQIYLIPFSALRPTKEIIIAQ